MSEPISVEVAAVFGDSVVDVKHCTGPRRGTRAHAARAWLAGAVAAVLISAGALAVAVRTAGANQRALDHWTRELHRPAYAFRPAQIPIAADVVAFGGIALAIVALGVGLARRGRDRRSPFYRIGTAAGVELVTGDAPASDFPLVAPSGDGFALTYTPAIAGVMMLGDATTPLAQLAGRPSAHVAGAVELSIPPGARIRARVGKTAFAIAAVPPPRPCAPAAFALERRAAICFGASLVAHMMVLAIVAQVPPPEDSASAELASELEGREHSSFAAHIAVQPAVAPADPSCHPGQAAGAGSAAHAIALDLPPVAPRVASSREAADEERASDDPGSEDLDREDRDGQQGDRDASTAVEGVIAAARSRGVAGSLTGGAFQSLAGTGDIKSAFDGSNIYGGLLGEGDVGSLDLFGTGMEPNGGFGFARPGFGPEHTRGCGCIAGIRRPPGKLKPRPQVIDRFATSDVPGDAGPIIRRYVHRNLYKITFCYAKALLDQPKLAGDLVAQFAIMPDGSVGGSTATGVDPALSSCVASVIAQIEFPRVPSGTVVRYPLTFRVPS